MKRVLLALRPWLSTRATRVLAPRIGPRRAGRVLGAAFERYAHGAPTFAKPPNAGGQLMFEAARLTTALYRALLDEGRSEVDARKDVALVTAAIYRLMAAPPWLVARATARSPQRRLRLATDAFRRFPFGPPAYEMRDVPAEDRTVAFDVVRCPVAEYMRAEGLGELCVESWCHLDFALAERWGARLERSTTLAGGAARCDFRWHLVGP